MLFFIRKALIFTLALLSVGCGALKSSRHSSEQNGYQHITSCGPDAIRDALSEYREQAGIRTKRLETRKEISEEIRSKNKCSTITRDVMSLFVYEGKRITFPCEIRKYFTDRGFVIETVKDLSKLKQGDTAIALILQRGTFNYHWITYPTSKNIIKFFGKDTILKTIYLLKR